jgi:WD40 repeat protein
VTAAEYLLADVARIRIELTAEDRSRLRIPRNDATFFGSGRLIGHNLVLTARHVVESEQGTPLPRSGWEIRLLGDQVHGAWTGEPISAEVVWRGRDQVDLALLELDGVDRHPSERIRLRFGKYDSVMDLDNVWVSGFPMAARTDPNVAKEYSAPATLRKMDLGPLYRLTVAAANAPDDGRDWSGCSGGSVILSQADDAWLLGVVQQVPKTFGAGAVDVAPLEPALADPDFITIIERCCSTACHGAAATDVSKLPGIYEFVGAEAFAASARTIGETATKPFFGRDEALGQLDSIFDCDRGVVLLRAEAGLGKSTLAARWAQRSARESDTTVLHHAFSVREPVAGTRVDMVENLARQAAFAFGPEALGQPVEATHIAGRFATFLGRDQAKGSRLIVIVDGLDEAAEPIEPLTTHLGRGVYILATARAAAGEIPTALHSWRERYAKRVSDVPDGGARAHELELSPLDARAIAAWLSAAEEKLVAPTDSLVARALQSSGGVPLFASFLIPDAIDALRAGAADPFPKSFAEYAEQQLADLRTTKRSGPWSWEDLLQLFGLLAVAKAPLPSRGIYEFFGHRASVDELDQRVDRWLSRRAEGVSFAHPRLASVFAAALPQRSAEAEAELIDACGAVWNSSKADPLKAYALTWLPAHLIGRGRADEAARLLSNGAFLVSRLERAPTEATVRMTATETVDLDHRLGVGSANLAEWRRFWSETEGPLLHGIAHTKRLGLDPLRVFLQLTHDRFGDASPAYRSVKACGRVKLGAIVPRLASACGFGHPTLRRTIHDAHRFSVGDLLPFGDGLVSYGGDRAIRFWDAHGNPRPGGDLDAHNHGVRGIRAFGDALVSWGGDGAIRFWDADGKPRPGGDPKAHPAWGVGGVLAFGDGLVSWGRDGAIRFWDERGSPRPGSNPKTDAGWELRGIVAFGDGLVSWGNGPIRLWDADGNPRPGGDPKAHAGWVGDVIAFDDGLMSGGKDGAIRFWDARGNPRAGGDLRAHAYWVEGMLAFGDGLVSWDGDGALRFWDANGAPRPGGDPKAHDGRILDVLAFGDTLVSWGNDGALRFWDVRGNPRPGGDPKAHGEQVFGVLAFGDMLVSWGTDGAIRFWDAHGNPRPGGDPRAHAGLVSGVIAFGDTLVSWGSDLAIRFWDARANPGDPAPEASSLRGIVAFGGGLASWGDDAALRFWDAHGNPRAGGDPRADAGWGLRGILAFGDALVSWGQDGAIRFWDTHGNPRPGGDPLAHAESVDGVLAFGDRLVSWSRDGAIRFWDADGNPRPGGDAEAHMSWVKGVVPFGDGLVSWGTDCAIRLWDADGNPRPGGDPYAHRDSIGGVLVFGDILVSWGQDGAIRFWDAHGNPRPGGGPRAHEGWVFGVRSFGDGLVSWGSEGVNGAIRFWDAHGNRRSGGDPRAHESSVSGVLPFGDGIVSWGADRVIRFWDARGDPRSRTDPKVYTGRICDVVAFGDRLVSWRDDGTIHFSDQTGNSEAAWFSPAPLEFVNIVGTGLWVGLLGRPFRLLLK